MGKGKKVRVTDAARREKGVTLEALLGEVYCEHEPPEGFKRRRDWAVIWNLSESQTKKHLSQLVAAGKMQMRWYRRVDSIGRPYRVPIYGIIKKEK